MNEQEKKQMKQMEQTISAYEKEVAAKDDLIRMQKMALQSQEMQIKKLTELLHEILKGE